MILWAKYLYSDDYDDLGWPIRHLDGVYTTKAVEEDKKTYYHEGYKQCKKVLKGLNEKLGNLVAKQAFLNVQMDGLLKDKLNTKQKRRQLQKNIEKLSWEIKGIRADIEKYEAGSSDESFCINIGLERCKVQYEEVGFFATDYEQGIFEPLLRP